MAKKHCITCDVMPTNPAFLYRLASILTLSYTPDEVRHLLQLSEVGFAAPISWTRVELRLVWPAPTPRRAGVD